MTDTQMDFVFGQPQHDPGGKIRLPLQPGVRGSALFSKCGRYRHHLRRYWGYCDAPFVLFIGMNPSTAEADVDDPTIRKEIHFTRSLGFTDYGKVNVMDFRATDPKALMNVAPCSEDNLPHIILLAAAAALVVCAWGALPKPLRRYADDVQSALREHQLYCMGKTKDGSPRHPLYLPNNAECIPWP